MGFTPIDDSEIATGPASYSGFTPISDDEIALGPGSAAVETPISLYERVIGGLKGVAKAGTDVALMPADLLYRGGNAALDYATGNETNLSGGYPSEVFASALNKIAGGEGDQGTEDVAHLLGNIGTLVAAPSQAKNIASNIPLLSKAAESSKLANLLAKTVGYGTEGAGISALMNAKSDQLGQDVGVGAAVNIAVPAALQTVGKLARGLSSKFANAADETLERGLGVQYGDRVKGLNKVNLYVDDAGELVPFDKLDDAVGIQAPIQKQIQVLDEAGILKNAPNDTQALKLHLTKEQAKIGRTIPQLVSKADEVLGGQEIVPNFTATNKFLEGYRPNTRAELGKKFEEILSDYKGSPGSGLSKLTKFTDQLQKETKFESAIPADLTKLKRMIQYDLRKAAESEFDAALPALKGEFSKANEIYAAAATIGKTLNKPLARKMPALGDYLTGGSLPMTALTGALSLPLGIGPAAVVSGGRLVKNAVQQYSEAAYPVSMSKLYKGLSNNAAGLATGIKAVGSKSNALAAGLTNSLTGDAQEAPTGASMAAPQSDPSFQPVSANSANQDYSFMNTMFKGDVDMDKMKAPQVIEVIKQNPVDHAIMLMESNGKPDAKNPSSSASGLFQLINSTAKKLGVKDVFDPAENYAGYQKLKADTIRQFGRDDVATIYASHYLGAPTLKKWINGEKLTATQAAQVKELETVLLPRLAKIYGRITKNNEPVEV